MKFFEQLSLTARMVIAALSVGLVLWAVNDFFSTREMRNVYENEMNQALEEEAVEFRLRFSKVVHLHSAAAKLFISQINLIRYIEEQHWSPGEPVKIKEFEHPPPWFPDPGILRTFVNPRHAILIDTYGNTRETYSGHGEKIPDRLLIHPDRLIKLSLNESYLTNMDDIPHLVTSETIQDLDGKEIGTLILSSPFDEEFLILSQEYEFHQVITAIISGSPSRIMTSSQIALVTPGMLLDDLKDEYLIKVQEFFEYGSSDMSFKFVSLTPRAPINILTETFIKNERKQRAVIALILFFSFASIIFFITKRIERLTERISKFSEEKLGAKKQISTKGNQLVIVENRFQQLIEEVLASSETIRKEAEEKARREGELTQKEHQLQLLQSVTEATGIGVAIEYGYHLEPINSKMMHYFSQYIDPDCFNVRKGFDDEVEFEFSDGTRHIFRVMAPDLKIPEKVVLAIDITDQKKAENEIRQKAQHIKLLLNSTAEAIYGVDIQGNCSFINPSCLKTLRFLNEEDVLGKNMHEILHLSATDDDSHGASDCKICNAHRKGKSLHSESEVFKRSDGSNFFAECWAHPIYDGQNIIGSVVTFLDITRRKQLEDQLRQSQKMEAIGTLTGGIAHDFNNIITAILGFSELLYDELKGDEKKANYAKLVMDSAEKAASLTNSLLAFSREQTSNPRPLDLNKVVKGVSKIIGRLISEDIEFIVNLSDKNVPAMADKGQLEQVLINLSLNARDAMPNGGTFIISTDIVRLDKDTIKEFEIEESGKYAVIVASDTGTGMDARTKQRIFEPFFTTKEVGKGTGLGLSMVYGIIKQHQGFIHVYSEKDEGTTFKIYLPILKVEDDMELIEPEELFGFEGNNETIFLAEDDASIRLLLSLLLEKAGYSVIVATDGEDAIEKIKKHKDQISLLLLDVIMPKKNGKYVWEEARRLIPDVHAIFMSGYSADIIKNKGIGDEGFRYISKPVSPKELLHLIQEELHP